MFLIVGLGNPEPQYSKTRHNMGFDVVNLLAKKNNIEFNKKDFQGIYGVGEIAKQKVILLKPQTFMNESGKSIIEVKNYFKIENSKLIVIYDDIDIGVGELKIRKKGGAGTHNGMKSVIENLETTEFPHIRIGTGMPVFKELLISHVLEKLTDEEYEKLLPAIEKAALSVEEIIKNGIDIAMNKFNSKDE